MERTGQLLGGRVKRMPKRAGMSVGPTVAVARPARSAGRKARSPVHRRPHMAVDDESGAATLTNAMMATNCHGPIASSAYTEMLRWCWSMAMRRLLYSCARYKLGRRDPTLIERMAEDGGSTRACRPRWRS